MESRFIVAIVLAFLLFLCPATAQEAATVEDLTNHRIGQQYTIQNMHDHQWFLTVMAASVVGWLLGMTKGFSTTSDWLTKYFNLDKTPTFVVWALDLFVFVVVGAYFGTGIYNPANFVAAAAAGISWPLGLGALTLKPGKPEVGQTKAVVAEGKS